MRLTHHHKQRGTRLGALLTLLVMLLASLGGGQLAAQAQAEPFVIQDIRVEGLQRISPGSVFAALPVGVGDTVDTFAVRAAAKSLFASGNFDDISIARDGGVLVVVVAERPSISEITIDGNKAIETEALLDGLKGAGLSVGQVFQRSTLEGMQLELQRQYVLQGRYDATIDSEVIAEPRNRVSIAIDVNEGTVATIQHINVVGNTIFSDEDLIDLFELKTGGWFSFFTSDNKYSKEKLTSDLETLSSYYLDRGYLQFNIDSTQVAVSPNKEEVYITANVTEGAKFTVSEVGLSGDLVLPEEDLNRFSDGTEYSSTISPLISLSTSLKDRYRFPSGEMKYLSHVPAVLPLLRTTSTVFQSLGNFSIEASMVDARRFTESDDDLED